MITKESDTKTKQQRAAEAEKAAVRDLLSARREAESARINYEAMYEAGMPSTGDEVDKVKWELDCCLLRLAMKHYGDVYIQMLNDKATALFYIALEDEAK